MAQPSSRQELIDYALRQNGAPVLEINVADEQLQDLMDDAIQFYQERHYDGVTENFFKYQVTQADIDRGTASASGDPVTGPGISSVTTSTSVAGYGTTEFKYYESSNYIQIPPNVVGVKKVFKVRSANSMGMSGNMFSFKYQLVLNDLYFWGRTELLGYSMAMSYLETMDFLLNTHTRIRFNIRQDRLYLDVDWSEINAGDILIIDTYTALDPDAATKVYNDRFLKQYITALVKKQWGQNLIKFQGVKLPGGVELNGRQMYDDGQREIDEIREQMISTYEIPPLDMIA
tara:strand:+ start:90 stop:953 length:864 start_codon:yes stop_codon:yes gene_type:complete